MLEARIASGFYRDSLGGFIIPEVAPRLAVAKNLLWLVRQGRRPTSIRLAIPPRDEIGSTDCDLLALHDADRYAVVFRCQDLAIHSTPQDNRFSRLGDCARLGQTRQRHTRITPRRLVRGGRVTRIDVVHVRILQSPDRHAIPSRPDGRATVTQTEIPLLGIHEQWILTVDVRLGRQRRGLERQVVIHHRIGRGKVLVAVDNSSLGLAQDVIADQPAG